MEEGSLYDLSSLLKMMGAGAGEVVVVVAAVVHNLYCMTVDEHEALHLHNYCFRLCAWELVEVEELKAE